MSDGRLNCWLCHRPITGVVFYQGNNKHLPCHARCRVVIKPPKKKPDAK